jgi:hypothetical protein
VITPLPPVLAPPLGPPAIDPPVATPVPAAFTKPLVPASKTAKQTELVATERLEIAMDLFLDLV